MLSGFPYGRTQHIRRMRSSIVSVIHYVCNAVFELFFCKKIPLSRRVGYVMDGSMGE